MNTCQLIIFGFNWVGVVGDVSEGVDVVDSTSGVSELVGVGLEGVESSWVMEVG